MQTLKIKKLYPSAQLPHQATSGSAGMDLASLSTVVIQPHASCLVSTGLAMEIPDGYEMQIRPRSGLASKYTITVLNSPGTIDSDYRGEVKVLLINHGSTPVTLQQGDRIAQAVLCKVPTVQIVEVTELSSTERGNGGFGSTGLISFLNSPPEKKP